MAPLTQSQYEHLQARHDRLVEIVCKMRHHELLYDKYHAKDDHNKARYYRNIVDQLLKEEANIKKQKQAEIF